MKISDILSKKAAPAGSTAGLIQSLTDTANKNGGRWFDKTTAGRVASFESLDNAEAERGASALQDIDASLKRLSIEHFGGDVGMGSGISKAQQAAGQWAAVMGSNPQAFLGRDMSAMAAVEGNTMVPTTESYFNRGNYSEEAFDERENRNAPVFAVAYNIQAARQDQFGEAFFPTITVAPDQVGFEVVARLIMIYQDIKRNVSGKIEDFKKRNLMHATIDPSILQLDDNKIIPVLQPALVGGVANPNANAQFFDAVVGPQTIVFKGESVTTAPLAFGKEFSLLGLAQRDSLIQSGLLDSTAAIEPTVYLDNLYLNLDPADATPTNNNLIKFSVKSLPTSNFVYAQQSNYRVMSLVFETEYVHVRSTTLALNGVAPAPISAQPANHAVRLKLKVFGTVNLELGNTSLTAGEVTVMSVKDTTTGAELDLTTGAGATTAALYANAVLSSYDLDARLTNSNHVQRGQLLDVTYQRDQYPVPLRGPITALRPVQQSDSEDANRVEALVTATRYYTSAQAVEKLLETSNLLSEVVTNLDTFEKLPALLGVGRHYFKPFYENVSINMATDLDSVKSHERSADMRAVLVNKLRDLVYRMYQETGYMAVLQSKYEGQTVKPTVIIGCDIYLAQWLLVEGDIRTLGNDFDVVVVSTPNLKMSGKIFVAFGDPTGNNENVANPMHFGNMAWCPELVVNLPISRSQTTVREMRVQPRFQHFVNQPILAQMTVTGISNVVAKKVTSNWKAM